MAQKRGRVAPKSVTDNWRGGNWLDPVWFLNDVRLLDDAGFPLPLRRRAAAQLQWLYPADVCGRLLENGHGAVVQELFHQVGWRVCPVLETALDLEAVGRFDDPKLLADLRSAEAFHSAATEVSVWANLKRAGFDVDRPTTSDTKTPDFRFAERGRLYRLEVKSLPPSDYEQLRRGLSLNLSMEVMRAGAFPGRLAVLRPTERLSRMTETTDFQSLQDVVSTLQLETRKAIDAAYAANGHVGSYIGGDLVRLDVEDSPDLPTGSATEELLPEESPARCADRALRLVRQASDQLRAGIGIVVIEVGESVDPLLVQDALLAKREGFPVRFSSCELVVVRGVGMNRFREPTRYAHAVSFVGGPHPLHQRIAQALAFRRFRNPTMGRRRGSRLIV